MSTTLNQYAPTNGAWVDANGKLTPAAQIWLRDLWMRTGGVSALSPSDLEALIAAAQASADAAQADADSAQGEVDALEIVVAALTEGHVIQDEGVSLTQRDTLDFAGAGVTVTDTGSKTLVTIPGGSGGGNLDDIIALEVLL